MNEKKDQSWKSLNQAALGTFKQKTYSLPQVECLTKELSGSETQRVGKAGSLELKTCMKYFASFMMRTFKKEPRRSGVKSWQLLAKGSDQILLHFL